MCEGIAAGRVCDGIKKGWAWDDRAVVDQSVNKELVLKVSSSCVDWRRRR